MKPLRLAFVLLGASTALLWACVGSNPAQLTGDASVPSDSAVDQGVVEDGGVDVAPPEKVCNAYAPFERKIARHDLELAAGGKGQWTFSITADQKNAYFARCPKTKLEAYSLLRRPLDPDAGTFSTSQEVLLDSFVYNGTNGEGITCDPAFLTIGPSEGSALLFSFNRIRRVETLKDIRYYALSPAPDGGSRNIVSPYVYKNGAVFYSSYTTVDGGNDFRNRLGRGKFSLFATSTSAVIGEVLEEELFDSIAPDAGAFESHEYPVPARSGNTLYYSSSPPGSIYGRRTIRVTQKVGASYDVGHDLVTLNGIEINPSGVEADFYDVRPQWASEDGCRMVYSISRMERTGPNYDWVSTEVFEVTKSPN